MTYIITKTDAARFAWGKVWGKNYKFPSDNVSVLYVELSEPHGVVHTNEVQRIYHILSGQGEFTIGGENVAIAGGDVVRIPPHTEFDYKPLGGVLRVILFMEYWDSSKWEGES